MVITRDGEELDEWDNPVTTEVWRGKCRYQQGVQAYLGISVRNSVVFIDGDIAAREYDRVTVTLTNGRVVSGVAQTVKNVKLPLTGARQTRIEVKQAMEESGE